MTLTRKLEAAFVAYLRTEIDDEELTVYEGHSRAPDDDDDESTVSFPALVVYAENSQPFGDMPPEVGIRTVSLRMEIMVDSTNDDDSDRERLDPWRDAIDLAMGNLASIATALNKPGGTDNRPIKGLHFYYLTPSGEPSEVENTNWVEQFAYDVIAQHGDG